MTGFSPGLRFAAAGALCFSLMSALAKLVGQALPTQEIILARGLVVTLLSALSLRRAGISLWGRERPLLVLRSLLGYGALSCFLWAVVRIPLAEATVIHFTNPVFTALLAAVFLGELLRWKEWVLTLAALVGVLFIARPSFLFGETSVNAVAVGVALLGAVLSAGAYVLTRRLTRTNDPLVIVFVFAAVTALASLPATVPVFVMPRGIEWLFLLGVGLATQGGQVFVTRALQLEKAGRAMTVGYLQIVFATLWGFLLFSEVPDGWTGMGAFVIILSTLLLGRIRPVGGAAGR